MSAAIFLIGLSGSGKSTVGRLLANRLQLPFVDTDTLIERQSGRSIPEIFTRDGERAFRDRERAVIGQVASQSAVISTGGGAPMDPQNRQMLRTTRAVFWLDAATETLAKRLEGAASGRPLLDADPRRALETLREQRHATYAACGTRIDTTDLSATEVSERIVQLLGSGAYNETAETTPGQASEHPLWVNTRAHSYPIYVGHSVFDQIDGLLSRHGLDQRLHVLVDQQVAVLYGERIRSLLRTQRYTWNEIPAGEEHKTLDQACALYDRLLADQPERGDVIVAIGGGVVGDMAGFLAATLLRGIRFVQVPTTLLAQVDSSVGGKVGVDHARGKNLIGAFYQPSLVLADLEFLGTLPSREVAAGWAEIIKIAVVQDAALFEELEAAAAAAGSLTFDATEHPVRRAIALKAHLVEQDERDTLGLRALLNYGHTMGHAIEAATGYDQFLHGEAVAIGMGAAARLATWTGIHPADAVARQDILLHAAGLPAGASGVDRERVKAALGLDKKREAGRIKWILPTGLGRARSGCEVPDELIDRALDWLTEGS